MRLGGPAVGCKLLFFCLESPCWPVGEGRAMASDAASELFDALPEQAVPERPGDGLPRLRQAERDQIEWRPFSLDQLIPQDHRVRLVWQFVMGLDLTLLLTAIKAVEGHAGHPPADPRILVALWLYATVKGVGSARELARLCQEHVAFRWLCGGVGMNAKTLADFRVDHGAVLERLLADSFTALIQAGVASLDRVAQDGVRVRASAGAASFRRHSTLEECRQAAEQAIGNLRAQLKADPGSASRQQAAARKRAAEEREQRVRAALAVTEELHARQQEQARQEAERAAREAAREAEHAAKQAQQDAAKGTKGKAKTADAEPGKPAEPRASTTDAEARSMKMADGGFRPAYNVQFAADTKSTAIIHVSVDNNGSDMGKMAPMSDALAEQYGRRPGQHLADGGCAKLGDIDALAGHGVEVFAPVPKPRRAHRDRHVPLRGDPPAVAAWRQRMGQDDAKEIYKERAATVELANAQVRNHGLTRFVVRGLEKVKAVALWFALAHNMMCGWRLLEA
jgi:transposase